MHDVLNLDEILGFIIACHRQQPCRAVPIARGVARHEVALAGCYVFSAHVFHVSLVVNINGCQCVSW